MASSLSTDDGPTSTTKALLVSIVAPRIFSVKEQKEPESRNDIKAMAPQQQEDEQPQTYDAPAAVVDTAPLVDKVSDVTASEEEVPDAEHTAVRLLQSLKNMKARSKSEEVKDEAQNNEPTSREEEPKQEEDEEKDDDKEEIVSPEEAAAVKKMSDDPDDAEINVEELIRLTFQSLLEEWHLLNFPVYTVTHRRIEDTKAPLRSLTLKRQVSNESIETRAWIQVQVMVQPASLGIILDRLERIGVGTDTGTVSVFRAELCRTASPYAHLSASAREEESKSESVTPAESVARGRDKVTEDDVDVEDPNNEEHERLRNERRTQDARQEWKNTATTLRVEQVREKIMEQSAISFDFLALLTVASILAGVGLITENTVVIVASMLVAPIMGPVLGCTFGTRIKDWDLVRSSFYNEVLALLGCIIIGVFVGLASSFTGLAEDWPTNEMQIRGESAGLLTGIAIAIPSGMGVCLSMLDGNTSSLVGVAISASLLPPAVNTGVCIIYSFFLAVGAVTNSNDKDAHDFAVIGGISLALTVMNIVCIWASGMVMFEIKEVAPTKQKSSFWSKDLKAAREWKKSNAVADHGNVGVHKEEQ